MREWCSQLTNNDVQAWHSAIGCMAKMMPKEKISQLHFVFCGQKWLAVASSTSSYFRTNFGLCPVELTVGEGIQKHAEKTVECVLWESVVPIKRRPVPFGLAPGFHLAISYTSN
jgi:hypothetical protein